MKLSYFIIVLLFTDVLARSVKWEKILGNDVSLDRRRRWMVGDDSGGWITAVNDGLDGGAPVYDYGTGGDLYPGADYGADGGWFPSNDDTGSSMPGGDSGGSMPGGDSGGSMPGGDSGGSIPGGDSGGTMPGGDSGGTMPGGDSGGTMPGGDSGGTMPGGDSGGTMPGGDSGGTMPGGDGGTMPGIGDGSWFPGSDGSESGDAGGSMPGGDGGDSGGTMPGGDGGSMPGIGGGWFPGSDGSESGDAGGSMPGGDGGDSGGTMPGGDGGSMPGIGGGWFPGSDGSVDGDGGGSMPGGDSGGTMPGGDSGGTMPGGDSGGAIPGGDSGAMPGMGDGGWFPGSDAMAMEIKPLWFQGNDYSDNGWMSGGTNNDGSVAADYGTGGWVPGDYGSMPGFPDYGSGPGGMPGGGSGPGGMPGGMPGGGSPGGWFPGGYTTAVSTTTTEDISCESRGGACSTTCEGEIGEDLLCGAEGLVCCLPNVLPARCGDPNGDATVRIVGGAEATEHSWPWQVSLQSNTNFHFCGGSLINDLWIVTAAHCVDQGVPQVVLGEHDRTTSSGREITRTVTLIIPHERYEEGAPYPNDIALLKLSEPVTFSGAVYPVCLPDPGTVFDTNTDECWISGWGDTRDTGDETKLNELQIAITPRADCGNMWGSNYILNTHVCVGDGEIGSCNGDSGGPLSCKKGDDNYWTLAGATSWGYSGCQTKGYPNVYTRVSEYRNWILDTIRQNM